MTHSGLIRRTLSDFFRELLQSAMSTHEVESSESTECYLVGLLESFAHPPADWNERPLALDYLESFQNPVTHRYAKLKRVGDTALFLSGIFMDHLERRLASTDYYMSIGRSAYRHLAHLNRPSAASKDAVFAEISERFPEFVRVFSEISLAQIFPGESQMVKIYTRWLRTRSKQDAQWLMRHGIVPVDPGLKSHN